MNPTVDLDFDYEPGFDPVDMPAAIRPHADVRRKLLNSERPRIGSRSRSTSRVQVHVQVDVHVKVNVTEGFA